MLKILSKYGVAPHWRHCLARFVESERGQDVIEYALLAAFIGIVGWLAVSVIDEAVGATYSSLARSRVGSRRAFGSQVSRSVQDHRFMGSFEFRAGIVVVIALLAVAFDLHSRRIPNWLTLGAAASAFIYGLATSGFGGLGQAVLGWIAGAAIFFPAFRPQRIGRRRREAYRRPCRLAWPCRGGLSGNLRLNSGRNCRCNGRTFSRIFGTRIFEPLADADPLARCWAQASAGFDAARSGCAATRVCNSYRDRTGMHVMATLTKTQSAFGERSGCDRDGPDPAAVVACCFRNLRFRLHVSAL